MRILSHRGNLNGKESCQENEIFSLNNAYMSGFDIEFDMNFDLSSKNLVLSHNPTVWTKEKDPYSFLVSIPPGSFSALNVKNLSSIKLILHALEKSHTTKNFFLFDFELLGGNINETRNLMRQIQSSGYFVAYRLSENEKYFNDYLNDYHVKIIWLDEFEDYWITKEKILVLKSAGKLLFYVSPELHQCKNFELIHEKWDMMMNVGIEGICTDHPLLLKRFINTGENSHD